MAIKVGDTIRFKPSGEMLKVIEPRKGSIFPDHYRCIIFEGTKAEVIGLFAPEEVEELNEVSMR